MNIPNIRYFSLSSLAPIGDTLCVLPTQLHTHFPASVFANHHRLPDSHLFLETRNRQVSLPVERRWCQSKRTWPHDFRHGKGISHRRTTSRASDSRTSPLGWYTMMIKWNATNGTLIQAGCSSEFRNFLMVKMSLGCFSLLFECVKRRPADLSQRQDGSRTSYSSLPVACRIAVVAAPSSAG